MIVRAVYDGVADVGLPFPAVDSGRRRAVRVGIDKAPPAVATFGSRLYVAYFRNETSPARIMIVATTTGHSWSSPAVQTFANGVVAKSPHAPCFTVNQLEHRLTVFWSAIENDSVFTAPRDLTGINSADAQRVTSNDQLETVPEKIAGGGWQTKIGNAAVSYRLSQQWIITATKNGEISIATNDGFSTRYNFTAHDPKAKSNRRVGACIVRGFLVVVRPSPGIWSSPLRMRKTASLGRFIQMYPVDAYY